MRLRDGDPALDSHDVIRDAQNMRAIMSTGWGVTAKMKTPEGALIRFSRLAEWVAA